VFVLLFVILSLASGFLWLFPLKEVKPLLLTAYNKDTQIIKIEPIEKTTYGYNKLMEIYAKQFVVDLHTIDGLTEKSRLKKLSLMTQDETTDYVDSVLNTENDNATIRKLMDANITRSVIIKNVNYLAPDAPNTWQIDWELLDINKDHTIQKRTNFSSVVTAETQIKQVSFDEEDLNPVGFTVIRYSIRLGNNA
jgi:type IV secretory pathway component VirB8